MVSRSCHGSRMALPRLTAMANGRPWLVEAPPRDDGSRPEPRPASSGRRSIDVGPRPRKGSRGYLPRSPLAGFDILLGCGNNFSLVEIDDLAAGLGLFIRRLDFVADVCELMSHAGCNWCRHGPQARSRRLKVGGSKWTLGLFLVTAATLPLAEETAWSTFGTSPGTMPDLVGHSNRVGDVCFSPDNATLISYADGDSIRFWHLPTCTELLRLW